MKHREKQTRRRSAFTLIEIMVATAIMIILVGLVIKVTSDILIVWNRSSGKLSAAAEARLALDLITRDLETAVLRNNGKEWLRVESEADGNVGGPYDGQTVGLNLFAPALDFVSDAQNPGSLCAIAYRLSYQVPYANGVETYILYRSVFSPEETFDTVLGQPAQDALTGGPFSVSAVVQDENFLVGNVIEFKVLLYIDETAQTGSSTPVPYNADETSLELDPGFIAYSSATSYPNPDAQITSDTPILYADVTLQVISDEGMRLLQRFDDVGAFGEFDSVDDIVRQHGNIFTRRVNFFVQPI